MAWSLDKKPGNLPRRRPDDPFERIYRHYHDLTVEIILTPAEITRNRLYEFAYDLYSKGFSRGSVAKNLMTHFFENEGLDIPRRTAFQYLRDAIDVFGDYEEIEISREKRIFIEMCKNGLEKALGLDDMKSYSSILQTLNKVYDFNKNTDELGEYLKKMKAYTIILTTDPEALLREADELMADIDDAEIVPEDGAD